MNDDNDRPGYFIGLDVGGTFTKAGLISFKPEGAPELVAGSCVVRPSGASGTKAEIIANLTEIIAETADWLPEKQRIEGIGIGFPGPFDYERGISYIAGLDKFSGLYGVDVGAALRLSLAIHPVLSKKLIPDYMLKFENDARLFALGACRSLLPADYGRAICLTLGTGCGSAFVENGQLVTQRADVPPEGWLYNLPFGDSIVDDYISRRGILKLAEQAGLNISLEVKELAQLAKGGDSSARAIFEQFGSWLGQVLQPHIESFAPDWIILGGQIAQSFALFKGSLQIKLPITAVDDGTSYTLAGTALLAIRLGKSD